MAASQGKLRTLKKNEFVFPSYAFGVTDFWGLGFGFFAIGSDLPLFDFNRKTCS